VLDETQCALDANDAAAQSNYYFYGVRNFFDEFPLPFIIAK
jgi:hypothetical protein